MTPPRRRNFREVRFDLPDRSYNTTLIPHDAFSNGTDAEAFAADHVMTVTENAEVLPHRILSYSKPADVDLCFNSNTGQTELVPAFPPMDPVPDNMDDLSFLQESPPGFGNVRIINPDGDEFTLSNLNMDIIYKASPSLACGFVHLGQSRHWTIRFPQTAVIALFRAIYQDDYTFCPAMLERPIPLLLHLRVFWLATKYRMEKTADKAWKCAKEALSDVNAPNMPTTHELCECIRFVYGELRHSHETRQVLISYCLQNYPRHAQEVFRQTVFQSPAFHKDLQQANVMDDFQQPHAAEITQLPVCEHWAHLNDMDSWKGVSDFTCEFHGGTDFKPSPTSLIPRYEGPFFQSTQESPKRKVAHESPSVDLPLRSESGQEQKRTRWLDSFSLRHTRPWTTARLGNQQQHGSVEPSISNPNPLGPSDSMPLWSRDVNNEPQLPKQLPLGNRPSWWEGVNDEPPLPAHTSTQSAFYSNQSGYSSAPRAHSNLTTMLQDTRLQPPPIAPAFPSYSSWQDSRQSSAYPPVSELTPNDKSYMKPDVHPGTLRSFFGDQHNFREIQPRPERCPPYSREPYQSPYNSSNTESLVGRQAPSKAAYLSPDINPTSPTDQPPAYSPQQETITNVKVEDVSDDALASDWTMVEDPVSTPPIPVEPPREGENGYNSDSDWSTVDVDAIC